MARFFGAAAAAGGKLLALLLLGLAGIPASRGAPWTQVAIAPDSPVPPPSMAHVAGLLNNGTSLVVLGGCTSSCCFSPLGTMWELRLASDADGNPQGVWRQLAPAAGDAFPTPRFSAASVVDPRTDAMYAFGGQDSSMAFLDELWQFDYGSERWVRIRTPSIRRTPPARAAASLSLVGRHLVLYGGFGRQGALNDVWALDLTAPYQGWTRLAAAKGMEEEEGPHRWHHVAVPVDVKQEGEEEEEEKGSAFDETAAAATTAVLVIAGGSDEAGVDHGDAWRLAVDLRRMTARWTKLTGEGGGDAEAPGPRHGHAALYPLRGQGQEGARGGFIVYGGLNTTANTLPESFLGDAFALDVAAAAWRSLVPAAAADPEAAAAWERVGKRAYASVGHGPGVSVVFGGFAGYTGSTDDRLLGDAWIYRHEAVGDQEAAGATAAE